MRYGPNDVWFEFERISLQSAAAASGIRSPLSLDSARNLDGALAGADGFATLPPGSLNASQRRFLASAASVLWLQEPGQVQRSLDSLAGHAHAALPDTLHWHAAQEAARLDARVAGLEHATGLLPWSATRQLHAGGHAVEGLATGVDLWLSPRLLVGTSAVSATTSFAAGDLGGHGRGQSPAASVHAHYRGDGWHATGIAGAGRTRLQLHRPLELGAAGTHAAHSQRDFTSGFLHAELGRNVALGTARLVPFVAVDYGVVRTGGFTEQGATGFELVAGPSRHSRLTAAAGARFARRWDIGRQELHLLVDARYRQDLRDDAPLQAAFGGVPDVSFELPALRERAAAELRWGLAGGLGHGSRWTIDYARSFGQRPDGHWTLGVHASF